MLTNTWLFAFLAIATAAPGPRTCPAGCNCTDMGVAICNTLDLQGFQQPIYSIRITHPKQPIILKSTMFYDLGLNIINSIQIENAKILSIDVGAFNNLTRLASVDIVNSDVRSIHPTTFQNINTLRTLKLSRCNIKEFEAFSPTVEELDLSYNKMSEITNTTFANLPELTYLNLASNKIKHIHPQAFDRLVNLEDLTLSNNSISSLPELLLRNLADLVSLDLGNNPLESLEIKTICDLEKLVLKSCNFKQFKKFVGISVDLLTYIDLSDNHITSIAKDAFEGMNELEYIDLSNNDLTSIDENIFKSNFRLQKVILDNNNVQTLPKFVCHNGYFQTYFFSCNNCGIKYFNRDTFMHLPAIVSLHLSNNNIKYVEPSVIQQLPKLIEIDLSYNNIHDIHTDTFNTATRLRTINFAGNPLNPIDVKVFRNNRDLTSIDMSSCGLRRFWKPLSGEIPSLQQLNMSNNQIRNINMTDIKVTSEMQILDLSNNPIECLPSLRYVIAWLTENGVHPGNAAVSLKTHEEDMAVSKHAVVDNAKESSWKYLAKEACKNQEGNEEEVSIEIMESVPEHVNGNKKESIKNNYIIPIENVPSDDLDTYDEDEYDYLEDPVPVDPVTIKNATHTNHLGDNAEIDIEELAKESNHLHHYRQHRYSFLWPTLVFVFTSLSVLVIAANVMLLILRRKGAIQHNHNINLPHIKIPQWNGGNKLKKHSGSVYRPLSEEITGPRTPNINRYEKVATDNTVNP